MTLSYPRLRLSLQERSHQDCRLPPCAGPKYELSSPHAKGPGGRVFQIVSQAPWRSRRARLRERKLRDARVRVEFHRCAANHAFANETRVGENVLPLAEHDATVVETAWRRTSRQRVAPRDGREAEHRSLNNVHGSKMVERGPVPGVCGRGPNEVVHVIPVSPVGCSPCSAIWALRRSCPGSSPPPGGVRPLAGHSPFEAIRAIVGRQGRTGSGAERAHAA
jgi:hypothetical protein